MDKYERKEYAASREVSRDKVIDALTAKLPDRAKGETAALKALLAGTHKALKIYDKQADGPHTPVAESAESLFAAVASRLDALTTVED